MESQNNAVFVLHKFGVLATQKYNVGKDSKISALVDDVRL